MKKILFLFLLFVSGLNAQINTDSLFNPVIGSFDAGWFPQKNYDCELWEKYTEWTADNEKTGKRCTHVWTYAEWSDVNIKTNITFAVYCLCGCGDSEIEARICELCKRHERRVRSWGYWQVERHSKYQQLLDSLSKK